MRQRLREVIGRALPAGDTRGTVEFIGEIATSSFAGLLTFWLCEAAGVDPDLALAQHLGEDQDAEAFFAGIDKLEPGQRSASTSNRNFEGRQGRGGRTHLVSPAVATATAFRRKRGA